MSSFAFLTVGFHCLGVEYLRVHAAIMFSGFFHAYFQYICKQRSEGCICKVYFIQTIVTSVLLWSRSNRLSFYWLIYKHVSIMIWISICLPHSKIASKFIFISFLFPYSMGEITCLGNLQNRLEKWKKSTGIFVEFVCLDITSAQLIIATAYLFGL